MTSLACSVNELLLLSFVAQPALYQRQGKEMPPTAQEDKSLKGKEIK